MPGPDASEPLAAHAPQRLLVYAHFDPDGVIQDYVIHALSRMREVCSSVRFVTTSRLLPDEEAKLDPIVDERLQIANVGFDFYMWKTCLRRVEVGAFDEIVLMNSSVYGPFCPAASLFEAMRDERCDAWGITESFELDRHLQSYFLVFRKPVLVSDAFRAFWDSVLPFSSKLQVIRSYELGLSEWLAGNGFTLAAFCPWERLVRYLEANPRSALVLHKDVRRSVRRALRAAAFLRRFARGVRVQPINPSVAFPQELIALGVPFLKALVLRDNPFDRDLDALSAQIGALGYPTEYLLAGRPKRS